MSERPPDNDKEKLLGAAKKLEGRDRLGIAAEGSAAAIGAAAGAAASGTLAGAIGVSTLFGSTTLASSVLGTVFVTSTPVGWVVGSAIAAGALGLGIAKACSSGGKNDYIRRKWKRVLEEKAARSGDDRAGERQESQLESLLNTAMESGLITEQKSKQILDLVAAGHLPLDVAERRITNLNRAIDHSNEA